MNNVIGVLLIFLPLPIVLQIMVATGKHQTNHNIWGMHEKFNFITIDVIFHHQFS